MAHISRVARRVLLYLALREEEGSPAQAKLHSKAEWVNSLQRELAAEGTKQRGSTIKEDKELPDHGEAVAWVLEWAEALVERADEKVVSRLPTEAGAAAFKSSKAVLQPPLDLAKEVRDCLLAWFVLGVSGLCPRITLLLELKAPEHAAGACQLGEACVLSNQRGACKGNRLERAVAASGSSGGMSYKYKLVAPHHKNSGRGLMGFNLDLDDELLCRLLELWCQQGCRAAVLGGSDARHLFINDSSQAFGVAHFNRWFRGMLTRRRAPFSISPAEGRHMVAEQAVQALANASQAEQHELPSLVQVAALMGNSPRTVLSHYAVKAHKSQALEGLKKVVAARKRKAAVTPEATTSSSSSDSE